MMTTFTAAALAGYVLLMALTPNAAGAEDTRPYAGEDARDIKALAPERVAQLRRGAGLGYAKAAELNGWPGPLHALELRDALALSGAQTKKLQTIRAAMLADATALGEALIDAERELDRLFATERVDPAAIDAATASIAALEGRLRATHLKAHLQTRPVLSRHQRVVYDEKRGYSNGPHGHSRHH